MKPPLFSMDQTQFYYPGQDMMIKDATGGIFGTEYCNEKYKELEVGRERLWFVVVIFAFVFLLISARLFEFTVLKESVAVETGKEYSTPSLTTPVMKRANITDRDGVVLATGLPVVNLYSDNSKIVPEDIDTIASDVVRTIPSLKYDIVKERLSRKGRFVYIKRNLTPKEQYEINRLGYPCFAFENGEKRVYPQGRLFSHVIGVVGLDNEGLSGIENHFDNQLLNENKPVKLSVDAGVQRSVHDILAKNVKHFKADGGAAIVMDVHNFEVISMVSLPDFDPNDFSEANDKDTFNKATLGVYEFGSIFKVLNTAIALETGVAKIQDKVDSSPLKLTSYKTIKDFHPMNRPLSITEVMIHSSNTASARLGLEIGEHRQKEYFSRYGLLEKSEIELPEVASPMVPKYWRANATIANLSYGYGIAVTPLQIINAVAAVVNGGTYYPASFLSPNPHLAGVGTKVLSEKNSALMGQILRAVVEEGSGRKADVPGYYVGGKTGTAEMNAGGKWQTNAVRASFVSVFPANDPKYAVLVMIENPKGLSETYGFRTAGWNAAKCTREIIENIGPQLDVLPNFTQAQKEKLYQKVGLELN